MAHFYENFKKLPPKHTTKNDLLMHVEDRRGSADDKKGEGGSSDYAGWYRKMTMRDGSSATSAGRDLGAKHALGKVVDPYKPANEDPVLFLDWNTVHEAGHAVDEKYRFMASRAGQEAFGGWTEYGMDTARVAAKLKDEFEYDLRYITELLAGDPAPLIPDPSDDSISFDVWEQRRQRLHLWYENAQADKNPWETEATARALELKSGEIIHDAYGNFWCGYLASARAKGITGYQFRSPLEWFSEIYAAKYLGKLQPTHPASLWLDSLAIAEAPKR